jgi:predicted transcriptional regulator
MLFNQGGRMMASYTKQLNLYYLPLHKKYELCRLPLRKKYRSHFEIIASMLDAVKDKGALRFAIMNRTSINCALLKKYLKSLVEMGFVELEMKEGRIFYKASNKGLDFLRQYNILQDMLLSNMR